MIKSAITIGTAVYVPAGGEFVPGTVTAIVGRHGRPEYHVATEVMPGRAHAYNEWELTLADPELNARLEAMSVDL